MEVRDHIEKWIELTPAEHRARTMQVATHWLRDRLHLDLYRMHLLEVWRSEHHCTVSFRRVNAMHAAVMLMHVCVLDLCQRWSDLELEADALRRKQGIMQSPNPEVG